MKRTCQVLGGFLASIALTATATAAPEAEFALDEAIISGTACSNRSHRVIAIRSMLRLLGTPIVLDLFDRWDSQTARESCIVRVPTTIPAGHYINSVKGYFTIYSDTDRAGAATVAISPVVDGYKIEGKVQRLRAGFQETRLKIEEDLRQSAYDLCDGDSHDLNVGINLAISGRRASRTDSVYVSLSDGISDGLEVLRLELRRCAY